MKDLGPGVPDSTALYTIVLKPNAGPHMPMYSLRRHGPFVAGSVAAGVLLAVVLTQVWPQLAGRDAAATTDAGALSAGAPPARADAGHDGEPLAMPIAAAAPSAGNPQDPPIYGSFAAAVRASAPAVVGIYSRQVERVPVSPAQQLPGGAVGVPYRQRVQENLGSGVIVDGDGHIVTNHHVIASSGQINVQLADGRTAEARVVGRDPDTDIAVLKVDLDNLPVMRQGRADRVAVGDVVLAIGNSFGLSQTVTQGIVSATGRADLGVAVYEDFIQTDAAINIGNSGGALVNARGELIGINTAVLNSGEGIGMAIPVDLVRGVMTEILAHGRVIRGWIGIVPEDVTTAQLAMLGLPHAGVFVNNLYRNSPAHRGGLVPGDMIEAIDGQPVSSARETLARIASRKPDTRVRLTVQRAGREFAVELPVVAAPPRSDQ